MPIDAAAQALKAATPGALIYTSPSYTDEAPKWRVLCPHRATCIRWGGETGSKGQRPLRRRLRTGELRSIASLFLRQRWGNPGHHAVVIDGDCVDLRDDLDAGALGKGKHE